MEDIANDPIIAFYMRMSNPTECETEVPLFSETMLRLSFKEVFGGMRPLCPEELQLYRKLLLFNFSENYTSVSDLNAIMTCFSEAQIRKYFDKHESIIAQWHKFLKESLFAILFREAVIEILFEYNRRHTALFGELSEDKIKGTAQEIIHFLGFEDKMPKQWIRVFNSLSGKRIKEKTPSENYKTLTIEDLEISNIYLDIKHRLNILVIEEVSKTNRQSFKKPPAKKAKTDKFNFIEVELVRSPSIEHVFVQSQSSAEVYDIDAEIQIANEVDLIDEEYEVSSSCDDQQVEIVETQQERPQEILQQVDILNDDDLEYYANEETFSEYEDNDNNNESTDYVDIDDDTKIENGESNGSESPKIKGGIINNDTALSYLAALQAYVVVNGHFQAIELLDKVDSLLRKKN